MAVPDCCVCLEPLCTGENTTLPCTHNFHTTCVRTWLRTVPVCPLCRLPVTRDGSAPAPPGEEGPNPLSLLWQSIAESTLNILTQRLREARSSAANPDSVGNSVSNQQFLMNLSRLIIENFVLAAAQNDNFPRSFEARVALRAPTVANSSGDGNANEGEAGNTDGPNADAENTEEADSDGNESRMNVTNSDGENQEGRLFVSLWEVVEETGRVVLIERFGLAARFSPNTEAPHSPPTLPRLDSATGTSPRHDPTPSPAQQSEESTPTPTETDNEVDHQLDMSQPPSTTSRVSTEQSDIGSSASTTRRLASKILPRRARNRPTPAPVDEPQGPDVPPERRSFASFRRWLRETMNKRSEASQNDNANR